MIELLMMGGGVLGPATPWTFVGATSALGRGPGAVAAEFPAGIEEGDLVVAIMSPLDESIGTTMPQPGAWTHWTPGRQDYLCTARYRGGMFRPMWVKDSSNTLFVSTLVFRAYGWTTVQIESNRMPAVPVSFEAKAGNQLLLNIGITPQTTKAWLGNMPGLVSAARIERPLAPAMQVYSANIESPGQISGIYADSSSGTERNLILSAF